MTRNQTRIYLYARKMYCTCTHLIRSGFFFLSALKLGDTSRDRRQAGHLSIGGAATRGPRQTGAGQHRYAGENVQLRGQGSFAQTLSGYTRNLERGR